MLASELREQVFSAGLDKVPIRAMPQGGVRRVSRKQQGMATGTVKFFNDQKGFGFISREDGPDVFVHFSNIEGTGRRTLLDGQQVEFEISPGRKGPEAVGVRVV